VWQFSHLVREDVEVSYLILVRGFSAGGGGLRAGVVGWLMVYCRFLPGGGGVVLS